MIYFLWECLIYLCNFRVGFRVWVTRRVRITRRVRVWKYFPTHVWVRVTRRVKFIPCGCGYGWPLPVGYVPVAISNGEGSLDQAKVSLLSATFCMHVGFRRGVGVNVGFHS